MHAKKSPANRVFKAADRIQRDLVALIVREWKVKDPCVGMITL